VAPVDVEVFMNPEFKPRVQVLTATPPTEGGIAEYSAALYRDLDVELLSDSEAWERNSLWSVISLGRRLRGELLHVQHEWLLYGPPIYNLIPISALILNKLKGGRNVVTLHTVLPLTAIESKFLSRFGAERIPRFIAQVVVFVLTGLLCLLSDHLIVHTPEAETHLRERYRPSAITVIPHGLTPREPAYPEPPFRFRYVGLINEAKGVSVLLEALDEISQPCEVIGRVQDGQFADGPAVTDRFLSAAEYHRTIRDTDVLVLPYLKGEYYAASGVLADAMAHGTAVIVTDIPQLTTVVEDERNGFVVPCGDSSALAAAIRYAANNPEDVQRTARELHRNVEKRSWSRVQSLTREVYHEVA
jgi:glycosyltransferase involved in cell wall biosynthesis